MKNKYLILMCLLASVFVSVAHAASNECPWISNPSSQPIPPMDGTLPCHLSGIGGSGSTILQVPGSDGEVVSFTLVFSANSDNTDETDFTVSYYTDCKPGGFNPVQIPSVHLQPGKTMSVKITTNCTYQYALNNMGSYGLNGTVNIVQPSIQGARFFTISKE